jgi:hypothetical protein
MLSMLVSAVALAATAADAPRLTVVISIDQFRADYLNRFDDLYLPAQGKDGVGGFKWLAETGANFVNAHYSHVPTETGPGHAVIGTGSAPGLNGIIGNDWFDRKTGKNLYCVSDADSKDVLTGQPSFSPRNLLVTTFGDELKMATAGLSKNISVSLKDRAAILMAGRLSDGVVWFDAKTGNWTSSDYYCKKGKLPAWAIKVNQGRTVDAYQNKSWTAALPPAAHKRTSTPDKPGIGEPFGRSFPHHLGSGDGYYSNFTKTPFANDFVLATVEEAIRDEAMGQDDIPDVVTINLASNDYLGHAFGPDSPEVMEMSVATDRSLSDFFRFLNKTVPGGLANVLIVVTADHGVMPMAEEYTKRGLPGGRVAPKDLLNGLKAALKEEFEVDDLISDFGDYMVYLNPKALEDTETTLDDVALFTRDWLREQPQIYGAFSRWDLVEQAPARTEVSGMLARSFQKDRSGEVFFFLKPGYILDSRGTGTGHGSPWAYDRNVPLLFRGRWLDTGKKLDDCGPEDITPTICSILGIGKPTGCLGRTIGIKSK